MYFKDVMVDDQLKKQLITLVKENRISHAQLFVSQAGTHSFALAMAYARYISCHNRGESDSCGECPSCKKFDKLSHPDLHIYFPNCIAKSVKKDPDSSQFVREFTQFVLDNNYMISIDEWLQVLGGENKQATINIRDCSDIINHNSTRSYEGGYKIFILWNVERLYHQAAPKLLKTLEEPEKQTLFILLTEDSDKLLATIRSRTQMVKIPPMSREMIVKSLQRDYNLEQEKAEDIAEISEGNYIKARELVQGSQELTEMLSYFNTLMSSAISLGQTQPISIVNYSAVQEVISEIVDKGREYQKGFLKFFIRMLRSMLMLNVGNTAVVYATVEEKQLHTQYQNFVTLKRISPLLEECNKAIFHIERNVNSTLVFTDFYLKLGDILLR